MVQVGAIYIWSYVYAIMRLSASKIDTNASTIMDNTSGETPYSEICTESLLPSSGCSTSEVPSTESEGKAKVSSDLLLLWFPIYDVQKLSFFKV